MPLYEHVFLARQDITAQQNSALQKQFQTVIEENGGKIGKTEYWGVKGLNYRIRKNRKAHFSLMNIDAPHEAVAEMERQMSLSPDVLRYLTIRVEELDDKPSVMMKRSDERGDRGDRGDRRGPRRDRDRGDRPARSDNQSEGGNE